MSAQQAGDDARAFLAENAAVRENGGQFEDGVPDALQVIQKPEINREQGSRSDEINFVGGRGGSGGGGMQVRNDGGIGEQLDVFRFPDGEAREQADDQRGGEQARRGF